MFYEREHCLIVIPVWVAALIMFVFAALYMFINRSFFCTRVMNTKGYSQNFFKSFN